MNPPLQDKPTRVLMFATGFAPYMSSANLNNSKLALAMLNRGWELDVISARDDDVMYGVAWADPWLPLKPITHEIYYAHGSLPVRLATRVWQSALLRHPIPGVRWAYEAYREGLKLHNLRPFDLVLSRFLNEHTHLPALAFARSTGVPWLANWNDPPGPYFPPPYNYPQPPLQRMLWERYYRDAAAATDFNTFPCERLADHMMEPLGLKDKSKVRVIPHIGLEGYKPKSRPEPGVFSLCHAGNLSAERNPAVLLQAIRRLLDEEKPANPVCLEIIGVEKVALGALLDKLNLREIVHFTGGMSYLDSLEHLASSSVTVIVEAPCEVGIFLPGKLADYASARRPILSLSPCEGTVKDEITLHGGGLVVDCTSVEHTYAGLRKLYLAWREGTLDRYVSDTLRRALGAETAIPKYEELFAAIHEHQ